MEEKEIKDEFSRLETKINENLTHQTEMNAAHNSRMQRVEKDLRWLGMLAAVAAGIAVATFFLYLLK